MTRPEIIPGPLTVDGFDPGEEYAETIALLQEEICRLEGELRAREEACRDLALTIRPFVEEAEPAGGLTNPDVDRLVAELAARDETINLLLDQLRLVEEAECANRAEWEQLAQWVTEVEERVERQDRPDPDSRRAEEQLDLIRRQADEARSRLESERTAWGGERRRFEERIARLESTLARSAAGDGGASGAAAALATIEAENRRLRQACHELEETHGAELGSLAERLAGATQELSEARKELEFFQDERSRERREYELAVASLRSQVTRATLVSQEAAPAPSRTTDGDSTLEADIRIRAFRQHLKEIHSHESESRNRQRLGARLSRLWGRTAPS